MIIWKGIAVMKTENRLIKRIGSTCCITIGMICLFTLCLFCSFLIPNDSIQNNADEGIFMIHNIEEYGWFQIFDHTSSSRIDNSTDELMLRLSTEYEGDSALIASMVESHARYWHGYMIYLRPLLCFIKYSNIRYIYMLLHMFLFAFLYYHLSKNGMPEVGFMIAIALGLTYWITIPYNMNNSPTFFITYIASSLIIGKDKKKDDYFFLFFYIVGMLTSFLDLLTTPLLTLGIPLLLLIYQIFDEKNFVEMLKTALSGSIGWGLGYAVSWASKWIISSFILKKNVFADAYGEAMLRTSDSAGSRLDGIRGNLHMVLPVYIPTLLFKITLVFIFVITLLTVYSILTHNQLEKYTKYMIFPMIASYPYIWFLVLANHSNIHSFYTYRIQIIAIVAGLMCIRKIIKIIKEAK